MGRPSFIFTAALVVLLIAGSAAVYAYDSSRERMIAEGVTVGGVDVGGLTAGRARARLEATIEKPLERPVRVTAGGERFKLTAEEAKLRIDVGGMVRDALAESREGNVITRTIRDLGGEALEADLPSRVTYSRDAVEDLVANVEAKINRAPKDAEVVPSGAGLEKLPAESGVEVQSKRLQRALTAELEAPTGDRAVKARTERVKPEVTQGELAEKYPVYLTIDRDSFQMRYYEDLKLVETYPIAVGTVGFETPAGLYHVQNKAVDPAWSVPEWGGNLAGQVIPGGAPNNPLKERWLGIYDGAGIHGTDDVASLGSAASHGCVRMAIPDVIELYDRVPVGSPIYIQ